jgi:hypothetical protein
MVVKAFSASAAASKSRTIRSTCLRSCTRNDFLDRFRAYRRVERRVCSNHSAAHPARQSSRKACPTGPRSCNSFESRFCHSRSSVPSFAAISSSLGGGDHLLGFPTRDFLAIPSRAFFAHQVANCLFSVTWQFRRCCCALPRVVHVQFTIPVNCGAENVHLPPRGTEVFNLLSPCLAHRRHVRLSKKRRIVIAAGVQAYVRANSSFLKIAAIMPSRLM